MYHSIDRQKRIKQQSLYLYVLFFITFTALIPFLAYMIYILTSYILSFLIDFEISKTFLISIITIFIIAIMIGYIILTYEKLSAGGTSVAKEMNAKPLETKGEFEKLRVQNIVEELAIASGIGTPSIFILENEEGINAFSAGNGIHDAVIIITYGAIYKLKRNELEGIIAHEFSHILNGDISINIKMIYLLAGIDGLAKIGNYLINLSMSSDIARKKKPKLPDAVLSILLYIPLSIGLSFLTIGYVGNAAGNIIKIAFGRKRELLADAESVRFTRDPTGIISVLRFIACTPDIAYLTKTAHSDFSSFLFSDSKSMITAFRTHPSAYDRIKSLDPSITLIDIERQRKRLSILFNQDEENAPNDTPTSESNKSILNLIPKAIQHAAHQNCSIFALLLALVSYKSNTDLSKQLHKFESILDNEQIELTKELIKECQSLNPHLVVPIVQLTYPALRRMNSTQFTNLFLMLQKLINLDGSVSLNEYCIYQLIKSQARMIQGNLNNSFKLSLNLQDCRREVKTLLAAMIQNAQDASESVNLKRYQQSMHTLFHITPSEIPIIKDFRVSLDPVWDRLIQLTHDEKEKLINSLIEIYHDTRETTAEEANLIRVVCQSIHYSLPFHVEDILK